MTSVTNTNSLSAAYTRQFFDGKLKLHNRASLYKRVPFRRDISDAINYFLRQQFPSCVSLIYSFSTHMTPDKKFSAPPTKNF